MHCSLLTTNYVTCYNFVIEKSNVDGTNRMLLTNTRISDPYFLTYYVMGVSIGEIGRTTDSSPPMLGLQAMWNFLAV